jgi:hypothetical protein
VDAFETNVSCSGCWGNEYVWRTVQALPAVGGAVGGTVRIARGATTVASQAPPRAYSVAFRTTIPQTGSGVRPNHFAAANDNLQAALAADAEFAQMAKALNIRIPSNMRLSPDGWTWHHVIDMPGVLELVPRVQHLPGSAWQPLLHFGPMGGGGMAQWGKSW